MMHAPTIAETLKSKTVLPVIVAPMFLVSTPAMALTACKEGLIGSFPSLNVRTSAELESWLTTMDDGIKSLQRAAPGAQIAPYAVNLIVNASNARLEDDLALCIAHKVPVIITSLGLSPDLINRVHTYGGIVLHDVTTLAHAKKAAAAGVDGLIAVCAGAGGHAGTRNPLSFVAEIRAFFSGFVALAGGLSTGQDILAAQVLGADFAYMGTRFLCTQESGADPAYKKMICDAETADIIYTSAVSGVPANFLRQSLEKAGFDIAQLKTEGARAVKIKPLGADGEEAAAWKTVWSAGHGAGIIHDIPTIAALAARLKQEYSAARQRLAASTPSPAKPDAPKTPPSAP